MLPLPPTTVPRNNMLSALKYSSSLLAGLVMTTALFLFIQRLVNQPLPTLPELEYAGTLALFQIPESEPPPETEPPPPKEVPEPAMETPVVNLAQVDSAEVTLAEDFVFSDSSPDALFAADAAPAQVKVASELLAEFGEDTRQGFIEITPFATRKPNIPKVAWQHQLNGWVLVVFNVSAAGKTRNIKVLDAHPKGVFEAEVIRAIEQWRYDMGDRIKNGQDLVLTQKINLQWQDYPQNLPYPE